MNMSNITFEVPRLSTFVFKKSSEKKIFTIIFAVMSLKGFGWNNVGPTSQTVAHNWAKVSFYPGSGLSGDKASVYPHGSHSKHGTITIFCFRVGPVSNTIDWH